MGRRFTASASQRMLQSTIAPSSLFNSTGDGSMACWFWPTAAGAVIGTSYQSPAPLGHQTATGDSYFNLCHASIGGSDRVWGYAYAGGDVRIGATYDQGKWTHWGWVSNGSNVLIYRNGVLAGTSAATTGPSNTTNGLVVGSSSTAYGTYLNGFVAECALWNEYLTEGEFRMLAQGSPPPEVRGRALSWYCPLLDSGTVRELDVNPYKPRRGDLLATNSPPPSIHPLMKNNVMQGVMLNG